MSQLAELLTTMLSLQDGPLTIHLFRQTKHLGKHDLGWWNDVGAGRVHDMLVKEVWLDLARHDFLTGGMAEL